MSVCKPVDVAGPACSGSGAKLATARRVFIFHRADGFYPLELPEDTVADNAECNPGTVRVEDAVTGELVWRNDEACPLKHGGTPGSAPCPPEERHQSPYQSGYWDRYEGKPRPDRMYADPHKIEGWDDCDLDLKAEANGTADEDHAAYGEEPVSESPLLAVCDELERIGRTVADIMHAKGDGDDPILSERLSDLRQTCNAARAAIDAAKHRC